MTGKRLSRNDHGLCAVRGCPLSCTHWRVAAAGVEVGYCATHHGQAGRLFDRPKEPVLRVEAAA